MITLSPDAARRLLLRATGLAGASFPTGLPGAVAVLDALGCIQLDPLDRVGTNADLVLHARVDGLQRGDWARTMPGAAFEHFAKERCLLPARLFPCYRAQTRETAWWSHQERLRRVPDGVIDAVLAEIQAKGPLAVTALSDQGRVEPLDWSGWKGTAKAAHMAIEVLWTGCRVVTAGRTGRGVRVYDVPERALGPWATAEVADAHKMLLMERIRGAGLLSTATGPHWSMLSELRGSELLRGLIAAGEIVEVGITGTRRSWLALPQVLDAPEVEDDDRLRVLGPLDPLLWDRKLVNIVFGFDYIWEVYKPAEKRQWGYYVTPLLHRGQLVGRMEARREPKGSAIMVEQRWGEIPGSAFDQAIDRLSSFQAQA